MLKKCTGKLMEYTDCIPMFPYRHKYNATIKSCNNEGLLASKDSQ